MNKKPYIKPTYTIIENYGICTDPTKDPVGIKDLSKEFVIKDNTIIGDNNEVIANINCYTGTTLVLYINIPMNNKQSMLKSQLLQTLKNKYNFITDREYQEWYYSNMNRKPYLND